MLNLLVCCQQLACHMSNLLMNDNLSTSHVGLGSLTCPLHNVQLTHQQLVHCVSAHQTSQSSVPLTTAPGSLQGARLHRTQKSNHFLEAERRAAVLHLTADWLQLPSTHFWNLQGGIHPWQPVTSSFHHGDLHTMKRTVKWGMVVMTRS